MKNTIITLALVLLLAVPVLVKAEEGQGKAFRRGQRQKVQQHRQEQRKENKEFRAGLKDVKPEERKSAMATHRETKYKENAAFREQIHNENMTFLRNKLANNKKLTDAQKTELVNFFESQYQENSSYRQQRHNENVAFFEKIANDPNLTQEQKKEAIKAHRQEEKAEYAKIKEEQRAKRRAEREKIRSEVKAQGETSNK